MTHADDDGLRRGGNHPGGPGGGDEDDGGGGWGGDDDDGAAGGRRGGEEGRWISVEGDEGRRVLRLGSLQKRSSLRGGPRLVSPAGVGVNASPAIFYESS